MGECNHITFTKGELKKIISPESTLIARLIEDGWKQAKADNAKADKEDKPKKGNK
jgi:hypothetical protein